MFCACRKDYLLAALRRHSRGNVLVRRLVASRTPTFRSGTSASVTSCIVQWLCHRFTVAHDVFAVGEGLMGNRREAPEPYCYALASVPGSRHA